MTSEAVRKGTQDVEEAVGTFPLFGQIFKSQMAATRADNGTGSKANAIFQTGLVPVEFATTFLPGGGGAKGLIHMTDEAGLKGIASSGLLKGKNGIFAVPESVALESTAMKVLRTGLSPAQTREFISIPANATNLFKRPLPIGPYSAWKFAGGVRFAPPGNINLATGAFTQTGSAFRTRAILYGPDTLFYGGTTAIGGMVIRGNQFRQR